ncbi:ABC transporter permease [Luteimicrobium sp. NPDC057192]|uniref:ABC transporter permease n=1 Tax=Luteimicrobium sp. NPDC057192 TaxID=3346042 RepID=UPI00363AE2B1
MTTTTPSPTTSPTTASAPRTPEPGHPAPRVLLGLVVALAAAIGLMVLAFGAPAVNSGAHDLPLAVSGPPAAIDGLTHALDTAQPGAFDVTAHTGADDVTSAIEDRDAVGGIVLDPSDPTRVTVEVASAAGTPYAPLLRAVGASLAAKGDTVTYTDVVPLTADDPTGAGLTALALPIMFGGMASAVTLVNVARRSRVRRVVASLAFSVLAGITATAVLQLWLGSVDGSFWLTAAGIGLGVAGVSLTVLGLESLLGYAGLGLGAVLMLFVANPLSGIATGAAWLPHPWGEIGQLLPIGAAGTLTRSAAFFDGAGAAQAVVVLVGWIALGLVLVALSGLRARRRQRSAPAAAVEPEPTPAPAA